MSLRIFNAKKPEKDELYPKLLSGASLVLKQSRRAIEKVWLQSTESDSTLYWIEKMENFVALHIKVIDQTQWRIYNEESVPAGEKFVSIFEPHTDIIVKGDREVQFGHKINLATQQYGFITYLNVEQGNPSDSTLYQPVLQASEEDYQQRPGTVVADDCYASKENVEVAKESGVKRNVFSKPVGLTLTDMGVKRKTFNTLREFRAGVEGNISELKRACGAGKAMRKGQEGFDAFVWVSALCYNLIRTVDFHLPKARPNEQLWLYNDAIRTAQDSHA